MKTSTANLNKSAKIINSTSGILPVWLIRLCKPSRMLWLGPLIALILTSPSLFSGYMLDDHFLKQNTVSQSVYIKRQPSDFFNFVTSQTDFTYYRERGILLSWWSDPGFRNHFFRPVASLVHAVQFAFFADSPWIMHAGLILLYALLCFLISLLLKRFSSNPAALGIAILLFAINDVHAFSAGWISSYNTLLCCVFGMIAFLMHDRWRQTKTWVPLLLFAAFFTIALFCSEGALALSGYLLAYALFLERGTIRGKIFSFVPTGIITVAYLFFYVIFGFGVKNSGIYVSLTDLFSPALFSFFIKIAFLLYSQLFSVTLVSMILLKIGITGIVIFLLILIAILFFLRKGLFGTPQTSFFFTATVLSIAPFALGPLQDRLLLWSGLGAAGLLGELFASNTLLTAKYEKMTARILLGTNLFISLLFFLPMLYAPMVLEKPSRTLAAIVPSNTTIFLNTPWDICLWYPPAIASEQGKAFPEHLYVLYAGLDTVSLTRTDRHTLIATVSRGWFTNPEYERFSRTPKHSFNVGDRVELQLMTASIRAVTRDGRPITVQFEFKDDLETYSWMNWTNKGPQQCSAPSIGTTTKYFANIM
jgi:hypothetical protein